MVSRGDLSESTSHETLTLVRLMREVPDRALRDGFGICLSEYRILANVEKGFERTAAGLARRLGVVPSRACALVSRLEAKGLVESLETEGRRRILSTTAAGSSAFRTCRRIVQRSYSDLLSTLTEDEREAFDIGTLATALVKKDISDAAQAPDRAYLYIQSYSHSELLFTKRSREAGLAFKDVNLLLALAQEGPMTQTRISKTLLLPKSSVCEHVQSLEGRGLVSTAGNGAVRVTREGSRLAFEVIEGTLSDFASTVRGTGDVELDLFAGLAAKIIARAAE